MELKNNKRAFLVLSDGTVFEGHSFGATGETKGEVVFNTSMMGYQEIMTDPSYKGQIVTMTYPLIGNYGVNDEDIESKQVWIEGLIVKEYSKIYSNWRANMSLDEYMKNNNIIGIYGIDTRALTKRIREHGSMNGVITTETDNVDSLIKKANDLLSLVGVDTVSDVTCKEKYTVSPDDQSLIKYNIAAYDFGIKKSIVANLVSLGCSVTVFPSKTSTADILSSNPDGIFLSNGPGDPDGVKYASENIKKLIGKKPIFGICLGHQLLCLSLGAKTFKLKFGHHGGNHPVKDLETGKIEITAQNHNYSVDPETIPKDIEVTHLNLNDQTIEGIRHKSLPIFSIQCHPEASPGPNDSTYLFKKFTDMIDTSR